MPSQEQLAQIFIRLRRLLKRYEGPLTPKTNLDNRFDLWSMKPVVIEGRKKKEVNFASLIIQSDYVGFYFMPVYADTEQKKFFPPELLKLLKGKSCFHFRTIDAALERQVRDALDRGYKLYRKRNWV